MKLFQAGAKKFKRAKSRWGNRSFMNKEEKTVIIAGLFLLVLMGSLLYIGSNFNAKQAAKTPASEQKISQPAVNNQQSQQQAEQPVQNTNITNPLDANMQGNIVQIDGGGYHTCLRMRNGTVHCWGQGTYGQLGSGIENKLTPARAGEINDAVDIQAGARFSCALVKSGDVLCWGESDRKQTGGPYDRECGDQSESVCTPAPKKVEGLSNAAAITAGEKHACARLKDGTVQCWGSNERGQAGGGDESDRMTPARIEGLGNVKGISAGDNHTCALINSPGTVMCWGDNKYGQAGGSAATITVPVTVPGLSDVVEVSSGGAHTCARHKDNLVSCWGYNYFGQLGVGSTRPQQTAFPMKVKNLSGAVQVVSGQFNTCARKADRSIACWGMNRKGELGDASTANRSVPTAVTGVKDAQYVAAGKWHYCFISLSGSISCWGENLGGQLGIGSQNEGSNSSPAAVRDVPAN
jgi:alpha-tubulin suppressor-like RCC1 family protein